MNAAIRALFVRCGFTVEAAAYIVSDQGINTLEEIRFLTDPDVEAGYGDAWPCRR